jgi:hypothetical protein
MFWDEYKLSGYNKDNTVIIDDYDEVYDTQPNNCIIATPFEFTKDDSESDRYLKDLQKSLESIKEGEPAKGVNRSLGLS